MQKRILLIEDDKIVSTALKESLSEAGFQVLQAFDGVAGLEMARKERPDLILLDLMLAKKHGFEVLKELKSSADTKDMRVVILSMLDSRDDLSKGMELGATSYIVKSQYALDQVVEELKTFFK